MNPSSALLNQARRALNEEGGAVIVTGHAPELLGLCERALGHIAATPSKDDPETWAAIYAAFEELIAAQVGGEYMNAHRIKFFESLKRQRQ